MHENGLLIQQMGEWAPAFLHIQLTSLWYDGSWMVEQCSRAKLDISPFSLSWYWELRFLSIGRFQSPFFFVCPLNAYTSSRTKLSCAQQHQETNATTRIRLRKRSVSECSLRTRFFIDLASRFKSSASPLPADGVPSFPITKNVESKFLFKFMFSSPLNSAVLWRTWLYA